ncbi:uncharacterized protein LOC124455687 isoform X2 [Xenia sp. Carnegie-2017]|nr:uncharacterized protein LOC124455687 isoform X2 [Xenia sp. Carnegie-2017]XP_046862279.1 uncharacterized protein LOC124455687 isoform X2 [Xenia sp. Carnegie-2017]
MMTASESSEDKANAFKLMRLIVDLGGEALRITLKKQLSENKQQEVLVNFKHQNMHILACSSKNHVFAKVKFEDETSYYMWHEDKPVNGWNDVLQKEIIGGREALDGLEYIDEEFRNKIERLGNSIDHADFSPSANKLLIGDSHIYVKVFDVKNIQVIYSLTMFLAKSVFLNDRFIISDKFMLIDLKCFKNVQLGFPLLRVNRSSFYFCCKRKLVFTLFTDLDVLINCAKIVLPRE